MAQQDEQAAAKAAHKERAETIAEAAQDSSMVRTFSSVTSYYGHCTACSVLYACIGSVH
jgi:hypothetical protein